MPERKDNRHSPHRLGPTHAVLCAEKWVSKTLPTIVNYCDFTCYWEFNEFANFVYKTQCDGAIPAYNGFHPHSLGSTYYAYIQEDSFRVRDIQEKQPFTDRPMDEFASSGTYYFRTGDLCLSALSKQIANAELSVNDEYYVSLAFKVLLQESCDIRVYPIQHFMQWGTPSDLEQYNRYSKIFRSLVKQEVKSYHLGSVVVPMAGLGKRFSVEGYSTPKPLISVSGRSMVIQAANDLPKTPQQIFVLREDLPGFAQIEAKLKASFCGTNIVSLPEITEGQAATASFGVSKAAPGHPITIGACDNGNVYSTSNFMSLLNESDADLVVWVGNGSVEAKLKPEMYGWVETTSDFEVNGVSVKSAPKFDEGAFLIIGTFTFRNKEVYAACYERLVKRKGYVNGELYIDSLIEDAIALNYKVKAFMVDSYIGWGTPTDLKIFEYWQSCFHKWESHPYSLSRDPVCLPLMWRLWTRSIVLSISLQNCLERCPVKRVKEVIVQEAKFFGSFLLVSAVYC